MFAKVNSAGLSGVNGFCVEVEADVQNGIPGLFLTGVLSTETREAQARVWNALKNSEIRPEPKRITVNLSPAFVRKDGTGFDLAVAAAILCGYGYADYRKLKDTAFIGEIGLDGRVKGVRGVLPLAFALRKSGFHSLIVAEENAGEASLAEGLNVLGCGNLTEALKLIRKISSGRIPESSYKGKLSDLKPARKMMDFRDVKGQHFLKRAAEIAVSGRHNILMSGPAGTGKTMIAKCMPSIMPELTREEDIEISKVYSVCGLLPEGRPLLSVRPFRNPHHGITEAAFAGGGMRVIPGELSLASGGILFLDELPLFSRNVLEILRQPLEDHRITVSRMYGSYEYPADFILAAAMNNCACGYYPDMSRCTCSKAQIRAYTGRVSKPLMERIDICAEADPLKPEEIIDGSSENEESSETIRKRVVRTYEIQRERYKDEDFSFNGRLGIKEIEKYCVLGKKEHQYISDIFRIKGLSGRTYHKILKVARTIADMAQSEDIKTEHLAEAAELRSIEDSLFGKR